MGFFNKTEEEKRFEELIRTIRNSDLDYYSIDYFVDYLTEIKDGKRLNDFYDFDFLKSVIIELCSINYESYEDLVKVFNRVVGRVKILLPEGEETEGYEAIKREVVNYYCDIERNDLFSNELYSLFSDRVDYLQIMDIVMSDPNLVENFDKVVDFATQIGKEIDDEGLLKREIISYLHLFGSVLSNDEEYLKKRIEEARMRYGVYPGINEKTLANISREVEKSRSLLRKLEILEKKVDDYVEKVDAKTQSGIELLSSTVTEGKKDIEVFASDSIKKMQQDLAESKKELLNELNNYLIRLEDTMKANSDQVFNQMLIDAREKLEQIRVVATSLSGTTTRELLRIQEETQKSMDKLKTYVESNPQLRESLKIASDSEEVMSALLKFNISQGQVNAASSGIIVPSKEIVVSDDKETFLVPEYKMTEGILPAFNREFPFDKRMKEIEKNIELLKQQGIFIPKALYEALPWYIMGKKIVYFYGPPQSGKTTMIDLLAKVVGSEVIDGGRITDENSVTSYNDVRGIFDENALFYAIYYGKTLLLDELDSGNPSALILFGTYTSKLVEKIDNPSKNVTVTFAKRRSVPVNVNTRVIGIGNTPGKGPTKQHPERNRLDESSFQRIVHIYSGYDRGVEEKIFGKYDNWRDFFWFFREQCDNWAVSNGMDSSEGNVTTADASTLVECINENAMNVSMIMDGLFVQIKEPDYLGHLIKNVNKKYGISEITDEKIDNYNKTPLKELEVKQIAESFVYEANKVMEREKKLIKRK